MQNKRARCKLRGSHAPSGRRPVRLRSPGVQRRLLLGLTEWLQGVGLKERQAAVEAWCEKSGATTLEAVQDRTYDLARTLKLHPSQRAAIGVERVEGLREYPGPTGPCRELKYWLGTSLLGAGAQELHQDL